MYSLKISQATTTTRFVEIKINIKLCNRYEEKSIDQEGYDFIYIFYLPYKVLVKNTNRSSNIYYKNQVINGYSWTHCVYIESGARVCGRIY